LDRLVCVAFPRTASTYLTESLKVAYPNIEVAHIFHKIDVLRKEKNIITILRKPEDTIASWMTKIDDNDIEGNLDWYNRFMVATLDRVDDIFITDFESITTDVNSVIQKCKNYYSLQEPNTVDSSYIIELLKENYSDRISKERNLFLCDKIKESKNYIESLNLYNKNKLRIK
jgi:hypothetical protein